MQQHCIISKHAYLSRAFHVFTSLVISTTLFGNNSMSMDCRFVLLFCLAVFLAILVVPTEGRKKKVVIHVPYKVKKIKHTHTVFKTIHHHHKHHDHLDHLDHIDSLLPAEEHEHFHHMHLDEPTIVSPSHSIPGIGIPGIEIPEFLPDAPLEFPLNIPDLPREITGKQPKRHNIPLFRRE